MLAAEHVDPGAADLDRRAGAHHLVRQLAELFGRAGVDDQPRVGVGREQRAEPLRVQVVRVLVGDEHRVQAGHRLEAGGERAGVEEQPGRAGVDEQAAVAVVSDLHGRHCATGGRAGVAARTLDRVARVVVDVMPKPEILDPQGQAVAGALGRLGIAGVADVRQGKHFELEVDDAVDDETLHRIAGQLLANPVIEDWTVTRTP